MKTPERLLDSELSTVERELLASAKQDVGSSVALRNTTAAMLAAAAASTVAKSAAAASLGTHSAGQVAQAGAWFSSFGKWAILAALGGGISLGAARLAAPENPPVALQRMAPQAQARLNALTPTALNVSAAEEPTPVLTIEDLAEEAPSEAAGRPRRSVPQPGKAPRDLQAELSELERARTALASGNAQGALSSLDQFHEHHATPTLGPEASVLRIEALFAAGKDKQGTELARKFLAAHPGSPHARRVRSLISK